MSYFCSQFLLFYLSFTFPVFSFGCKTTRSQVLLNLFLSSVNVFQYTLAKLDAKLAIRAGSCTAWNMEFSPMARCRAIKQLVMEMILSTHFSAKLEQENMFLERFLSI